jgi:hypothetical protein
MKRIGKVILLFAAVLFLVVGLRWLVNPDGIVPGFGVVLDDGLGRSTQVGIFSAFFLTLGFCVLMALVSGRRVWYYPPAMLLLLTATGRLLSWVAHDAAFALGLIGIEVVVAALLLAASRWLAERD